MSEKPKNLLELVEKEGLADTDKFLLVTDDYVFALGIGSIGTLTSIFVAMRHIVKEYKAEGFYDEAMNAIRKAVDALEKSFEEEE